MHLTEDHIEVLRLAKSEVLTLMIFYGFVNSNGKLTPKGRQALSEVWQDKQKSEKR